MITDATRIDTFNAFQYLLITEMKNTTVIFNFFNTITTTKVALPMVWRLYLYSVLLLITEWYHKWPAFV